MPGPETPGRAFVKGTMVTLLDRPKETPTLYVPERIKNEGEPVLLGGKEKAQRTLDGKWISHRTWKLTNPKNGRTQVICLLDDEMSDDEVATAYGEAKERFLEETNGLPRLVPHTPERRKAIGAAIREHREAKARMRESSNGRLFY